MTRLTSVLLLLLPFAHSMQAAVLPADLTPAEINETVQAGTNSVAVLTKFAAAKAEESKAPLLLLQQQYGAVNAALQKIPAVLTQLEPLLQTDVERRAAKAIRDRAAAAQIEAAKAAVEQQRRAAQEQFYMSVIGAAVTAIAASGGALGGAASAAGVVSEKDKHLAELKALFESMIAAQKKIDSVGPGAVTLLKQKEDAEKALPWFRRISQEQDQAARVLAAARSNIDNAGGLTTFLRTDSPATGIDVREVRDVSGILMLLRIGTLTHCFSPKLQCGGRPYTVSP